MLNEEMLALGTKRSVIREIFEYGKSRAAEIGADKVFDFSIGNPSIPAPDCVKEAIFDIMNTEPSAAVHGYTSAQGAPQARRAIAAYLSELHGTKLSPDNLYLTCGAAASLMITCKAMAVPGDEFIIFAPYFPEYTVYVAAVGAKLVVLPPDEPDFQIDIEALRAAITENTKAVLINSPNNPSGAVYSEASIKALASVLEQKEKEYGHPIYLIADEPYRELVYGDIEVPWPIKFYKNTIICYSYSKSLSLPGERIGYILVSPELEKADSMYAAVCGAGRALGFVCAPSLFQQVIERCQGKTGDIKAYMENRDLLYGALKEYGYSCVHPDGAFYLFMKTPEADAEAFCEKAKKYELLLVAGDGFGAPGYARISYCVSKEQIERSLPAFKALAEEYGLTARV